MKYKDRVADTELERRLQKNLRRLRIQANYRQEDLALLLHMSRSNYSYYESGHTHPSAVTLYRLCSPFTVWASTLFSASDSCAKFPLAILKFL